MTCKGVVEGCLLWLCGELIAPVARSSWAHGGVEEIYEISHLSSGTERTEMSDVTLQQWHGSYGPTGARSEFCFFPLNYFDVSYGFTVWLRRSSRLVHTG